jgi:predicted metalloprotease with PDZ domain
VWGRAGLHTGDQLAAINGAQLTTMAAFRGLLGRLRIGDTVRVEVIRPAGAWRTSVVVPGYDRPSVRIEEIPDATERQRALRTRWLSATP